MKKLILAIAFSSIASYTYAQPPSPCPSATGVYQPLLINSAGTAFWACQSGGWVSISVGPVIPSGLLTFISSGVCPTGWTEATELNGKTIIGTLAANGNVGTTGGADSITPAGSISALTFTGTSVNSQAITAGTPSGTISALTTGADSSTTGGVAKAIAQTPIFTGSALGTHLHTVTAAGTINTPAFTGTQFDNRSAFVRLIGCRKS
jgi:hypothetical protein